MSDRLTDLILSLTPEDGSSIGNGAMMALLRERVPDLTPEGYATARDALVDEGVIGRGRGRGGSIYRLTDEPEDVDDPEDPDDEADGFDLSPTEDAEAPARRTSGKRRAARRANGPVQVLSYRHDEKRVNNPEVGMVHAGTDPDGARMSWAYDPHIDPTLNFDSKRAGVEGLIEAALPSRESETSLEDAVAEIASSLAGTPGADVETIAAAIRKAVEADRRVNGRDRMKAALEELRGLQAPYLNWTGKAEKTSFEVDTVSLHVHERVDPATILRAVKKRMEQGDGFSEVEQLELFAPAFPKQPLRHALDFYHHEKGWANRLVAGDSLLVMNSLLTKESMGGKVQMIYIDPPYGIKYGSNFQPFTNKRDVKDRSDDDLTQEPETIKAFRDTWELGIHSYLTYLRDRLMLARELLAESGSVFVQIGDENVHRARALLDEIFDEENLVSQIVFQTTSGAGSPAIGTTVLARTSDYLLWYAKDLKKVKYRQLYASKDIESDRGARFRRIQTPDYARRPMRKDERDKVSELPDGTRVYRHDNLTSQSGGPTTSFSIELDGIQFKPGNSYWKTNKKGVARLNCAWRLGYPTVNSLSFVRFLDDFSASPISNNWQDVRTGAFTEDKNYVVQTATKVVERCLLMSTDPGDLVLDPTCGSGTTAFVAEKWGRRWITCDTSRVAITLAKQRLMTASFDYYALRYPNEGLKGGFDYETVPHVTLKSIANNPDIDTIYADDHPKVDAALAELNAALNGQRLTHRPSSGKRAGTLIPVARSDASGDLAIDDVPLSVPEHWPDAAREAHKAVLRAKKGGDIGGALEALNRALDDAPLRWRAPQGGRKGAWIDFCAADGATVALSSGEPAAASAMLEWEVPFDFPDHWPDTARSLFDAFHAARQAMQRRMDQSIADHAEPETLYDKPRRDDARLRVTGPFSVEAVPAPTVLSLDETAPPAEADETVARTGETSRQTMWRDELLKTGVRGKGHSMLRFAEFETLPSCRFLHASGSLAESGERVVVSFGPEHAALEQRQVEEAMEEAYRLLPRPKFILFCAFAFDPEAAKDIDEMNVADMTFLKVQMNTDLLTEDLKKKRASNQSFWLMGQPDVDLRRRADGKWEIEVNGFDYFDPKKGDVDSGGKSQIAMWALDTDYDQRSLMPRQVFFPMADDKGGWNRLRATVRAELDEDLLEQFHGTVSLPFETGENRRIAVKIVDDRGIESLKIIPLEG